MLWKNLNLTIKTIIKCRYIKNEIQKQSEKKTALVVLLCFLVFFFFGCFCSTQKFPGQGSNLCYSSDPSPSSDNTGFLTC